jgi:hypothetical protein
MHSITEFAGQIQKILSQPLCLAKPSQYLDLAQITDFSHMDLKVKANTLPEPDPIAEATFLIIESMKECHLSQTKIGINELFKAYLNIIDPDQEEKCTKLFAENIFQIYLYSLQKEYPYTDLLWSYLSSCFHVVS